MSRRFGQHPAIFAGLVLGTYIGSILSIFSFTIGATLLYFCANKLFKDKIANFLEIKYPIIRKISTRISLVITFF